MTRCVENDSPPDLTHVCFSPPFFSGVWREAVDTLGSEKSLTQTSTSRVTSH